MPSPAQSPDPTLAALLESGPGTPILIRGATVVSMDGSVGNLDPGDILVRGRKIEAIAPDLSAAAADGQAIVIDAAGTIAIPGMHDTHRHCWQNQFRRLLPNADQPRYVAVTHVLMGPLYRPEDMYVGTLLSALGAIASGVTCVLDFSHNARSAAHSDACVAAWRDAGIRAVHASCGPVSGDWDEQWPDDLERLRSEQFADDDGLVTLRMGLIGKAVPEINDTIAFSPENLRRARELELAVSVDGLFGPRPSREVEEMGATDLLGEDITYIHCQDISTEAWKLIAESGGHVSLAPTSDARVGLAGGITPVQQAIDLGIRPSLSVDVECCLTTDMFAQMQMTLGVQRMMSFGEEFSGAEVVPERLTVRDALEFATVSGAKANALDHKVGTLCPGKDADIVLIRSDDPHLMPLNNAVGTVVSGADTGSVDTVLVAGRPLKWRRELVGQDLAAIHRRALESRDRLLDEAGLELDVFADERS